MLRKIVIFLFALFVPFVARAACTSDEIDVLGDGTQCETAKFSVTTTTDATNLKFSISALGTFYVDCGDGGTFSQDTSDYGTLSGNTITRTGTNATTYTCIWNSAGAHTIRFGGTATGYNTLTGIAAIAFRYGTQQKVASVSGNMSAMFPYITANAANGAQPRFYRTFADASNLTNISPTLFANYTTGATCMFDHTFKSTGLTSIPGTLFSSITTAANSMFSGTFVNCYNISGFIPSGTFAGLIANGSPSAGSMWSRTFYETGLVDNCANYGTQFITGYESEWNGFVSCNGCQLGLYGDGTTCTPCNNKPNANSHYTGSGTNNDCPWECNGGYELDNGVCTQIVCTGVNYWSSGCLTCPVGYRDNTNSGKVGINSCQISCPAGTYVAEPADETLSAIPDGYTQLEYLSSGGSQYIDTGFTHSSPNIRGEVFVSFASDVSNNKNMNIMGNQEKSTGHTGYSVGWNKFFKLWTESSNSRLNGPDYALTAGTVHKLIFELTDTTRSLTYADQTVSDTFTGGNIVGSKNIFLFDSGTRESNRYFNGRIHKISLYEDDVLVHEFVPVIRNNDSVVGIYDITTNTFMTNSGTGSFGAGPAMDNTAGTCVDVGAGYYSAAQMTNYGSTGVRTACTNGPANSSYTAGATTNACPWACDTGATEYVGACHNVCSIKETMRVGNAAYPLFADRSNVTNPTLNIKDSNGTVCHMYFEPDTAEDHNGLKVLYTDGVIYHAIDPR